MTFADFILAHEGDDPVRLLLSRDKYPGIDVDLAVSTIEARARLKAKIPEWYEHPGLYYPSRLCAEQCSSSRTARFKARLASATLSGSFLNTGLVDPGLPGGSHVVVGPVATLGRVRGRGPIDRLGGVAERRSQDHMASGFTAGRRRIADLTGGLGVDSQAFAEVASEVLYNEMNPALFNAVKHNFLELGIGNVRFSNKRLEKNNMDEVLGDFNPDMIYMDPARRSEDGRKVFLLEDCSPDVLTLLPELFGKCRFVLLKLSPMADISLLRKQLPHIRDIYIVSVGGECKELLFLLDREWTYAQMLNLVEDDVVLDILPNDKIEYVSEADKGLLCPESYLFEPSHALAKSGAFSYPCIYNIKKLAPSTHLYASEGIVRPLQPYGKWYCILEVRHLDKRSIKEMGQKYPQADVSARNIPMKSDELRERLGCSSGGNVHIFGISTTSDRLLVVCRKARVI